MDLSDDDITAPLTHSPPYGDSQASTPLSHFSDDEITSPIESSPPEIRLVCPVSPSPFSFDKFGDWMELGKDGPDPVKRSGLKLSPRRRVRAEGNLHAGMPFRLFTLSFFFPFTKPVLQSH